MKLYLLRHALALEPGTRGITRDADRPLAPEGERKTRRTAEAMQALELSFDLILSSPFLRARQTAEIIANAFNAKKLLEFSATLAPGGSFRKLIACLNHDQPPRISVLLVGHEPYLSDLIALLVFGQEQSGVVMKKGGLCGLAIEGTLKPARCAALEWLLTPRQLRLIA
jgi:phosphohistidine phosphatase